MTVGRGVLKISQTKIDLPYLEYTDNDIESISKKARTKYIKKKVTIAAFAELSNENSTEDKTKIIQFEDLKIGEYLESNKRTSLSKLIFSICSKTIDFKEYQPWKYENDKCIKCHLHAETMNHFTTCSSYVNEACENGAKINGLDSENITRVGLAIEKRFKGRKKELEKTEVGQRRITDSPAQGNCWALSQL